MAKLPVIEIFGPTIQGEGAAIGLKTMFVRLYGCDYACSWCDSAFTWDGSGKTETRPMDADAIVAELDELGMEGARYVTISGGNPALYGEPAADLIDKLHRRGKRVIVETQGSRWQPWFADVDILTISPKPPSSGMDTDWAALDGIMERLDARRAHLKVVVFDDNDYEYAKKVHARYPHFPISLQVGNADPKEPGDISGRLLRELERLAEKAIADPDMADARVLPQLHALIWHNKRGK